MCDRIHVMIASILLDGFSLVTYSMDSLEQKEEAKSCEQRSEIEMLNQQKSHFQHNKKKYIFKPQDLISSSSKHILLRKPEKKPYLDTLVDDMNRIAAYEEYQHNADRYKERLKKALYIENKEGFIFVQLNNKCVLVGRMEDNQTISNAEFNKYVIQEACKLLNQYKHRINNTHEYRMHDSRIAA